MDEVEVIQNYLLTQAGENTDVILGMGYDQTLGDRIGITLIATGFEHKDPFAKPIVKKEEPKPEEKIIMILKPVEKPAEQAPSVKDVSPLRVVEETVTAVVEEKTEEPAEPVTEDAMMPRLVEEIPVVMAPVIDFTDMRETEEPETIHFELKPVEELLSNYTIKEDSNSTVGKMSTEVKNDSIHSIPVKPPAQSENIIEKDATLIGSAKNSTTSSTTPVSAASGGYLARPSNIYAESKTEVVTSISSVEEPVPPTKCNEEDELLELQMQIVERDDIPAADMPLAHQAQTPLSSEVEDPAMQDETEEQKRRAAERLHKLRNLSFNVNAADPNNEFETVPAYIRRNMELYNHSHSVENFYSSYEVKTDKNNQTQISTINSFLEGKKPD
jgi:cell division protein FtsZ